MTAVATFDIPFGLSSEFATVRDAYTSARTEGPVQRRRINERSTGRISLSRRDASEGDVWRATALWDLTYGVLEMDLTHPETGAAMLVAFVSEPRIVYLGAKKYSLDIELEEVL